MIEERYGNLFEMYERITDEDPYKVPMRIYPAVHYTMGGLWVDYNLMSNVPGLYVLGEANFSDHGANRLGASALMQGLADGYFVLPSTISDYLAPLLGSDPVPTSDPVFQEAEAGIHDQVHKLMSNNGTRSVDHFHRELGNILWDNCGMARSRERLEKAHRRDPRAARGVPRRRPGARRRRDAQPVAREGRARRPTSSSSASCSAGTRSIARSPAAATSGWSTRPRKARRCATTTSSRYVGAWEFTGRRHDRPSSTRSSSTFEYVHLAQRSYK